MNTLLALIIALVIAASGTEECEPFAEFFAKMQVDQTFRGQRISPQFSVEEEISWGYSERSARRAIPCGINEMERHGWSLFTDTRHASSIYLEPRFMSPDKATLTLGVEEGLSDALYSFERIDGLWYLVGLAVISSLDDGDEIARLPCDEDRAW